MFAFRGVFYDPLRELRLNALNLLLSVRLDAPGTQFLVDEPDYEIGNLSQTSIVRFRSRVAPAS